MSSNIYPIEGMTCATCASTVERTAQKTVGVISANVNLASEKLNITTEEGFDPEQLKEDIHQAGYTLVLPEMEKRCLL